MEITLEELKNRDKNEYVLVDVRGENSYNCGHIEGAVCPPKEEGLLEFVADYVNHLNHLKGDEGGNEKKAPTFMIYCTFGEVSLKAVEELRDHGYSAYSIKGGYREYLLKSMSILDEEEKLRYSRQLIMPEIGLLGQEKLKKSRVLVVGAGGLGAPVALYLAGAGVGHIGIADRDGVSLSNLHRQIIHKTKNVDMNKAESAKKAMQELNSRVEVTTYQTYLTVDNIEEIVENYDFIIDAVDNFETKFLINDTCVLLKKPFCHAGVIKFHGQVLTYVPGEGPCYRCIFQEIPEAGSVPGCSEAGVMGPVVGVIGSVQALEAIKYITGAGDLLTGKLFTFDGLTMRSRLVSFPRADKNCRVCGPDANIRNVKENAAEYVRGCMS